MKRILGLVAVAAWMYSPPVLAQSDSSAPAGQGAEAGSAQGGGQSDEGSAGPRPGKATGQGQPGQGAAEQGKQGQPEAGQGEQGQAKPGQPGAPGAGEGKSEAAGRASAQEAARSQGEDEGARGRRGHRLHGHGGGHRLFGPGLRRLGHRLGRRRRRSKSPFVLRRGSYVLELTGQLQVQGVLYLGSEALYENGDPASDEGVLIRRARIGIRGRLPYFFHYELSIEAMSDLARASEGNGLAGQFIGAQLLDAYLLWRPWRVFGVGAGATKVPGAKGRMVTSRLLQLVERPLSVEALVVDRRPGIWIGGQVRWFSYSVGFFNADKGVNFGNEGGGYMVAARMEVAPFGGMGNYFPDPTPSYRTMYHKVRFGAGTSFQYAHGPATDRMTASADLGLKWHGLSVALEGIVDWRRPTERPTVPSALPEDVLGVGAYGQVGYFILPARLEAAVRFEYLDPNLHIDTSEDIWALSGAVNYYWTKYLRVQLAYTHKQEINHAQVDNDALVVQAQAAF